MPVTETARETLLMQALEALLFEAGRLGLAPEHLARAAGEGLLDESRFYRSSTTDDALVSVAAIEAALKAVSAYPQDEDMA